MTRHAALHLLAGVFAAVAVLYGAADMYYARAQAAASIGLSGPLPLRDIVEQSLVELGPGRVALVVADIAGKGIAAALLMANLQANLRARYGTTADDLPRLLQPVNKLFFENTAENQYATLVIAEYDAGTRRMRYANCGHFPPILLHPDGSSEHLMATATVLGLFEQWEVTTCERALARGDLLVIYTDGMIEAMNRNGDEFGSERLLETIKTNRALRAGELVTTLHAAVQTFSEGVLTDDLTVVVARAI